MFCCCCLSTCGIGDWSLFPRPGNGTCDQQQRHLWGGDGGSSTRRACHGVDSDRGGVVKEAPAGPPRSATPTDMRRPSRSNFWTRRRLPQGESTEDPLPSSSGRGLDTMVLPSTRGQTPRPGNASRATPSERAQVHTLGGAAGTVTSTEEEGQAPTVHGSAAPSKTGEGQAPAVHGLAAPSKTGEGQAPAVHGSAAPSKTGEGQAPAVYGSAAPSRTGGGRAPAVHGSAAPSSWAQRRLPHGSDTPSSGRASTTAASCSSEGWALHPDIGGRASPSRLTVEWLTAERLTAERLGDGTRAASLRAEERRAPFVRGPEAREKLFRDHWRQQHEARARSRSASSGPGSVNTASSPSGGWTRRPDAYGRTTGFQRTLTKTLGGAAGAGTSGAAERKAPALRGSAAPWRVVPKKTSMRMSVDSRAAFREVPAPPTVPARSAREYPRWTSLNGSTQRHGRQGPKSKPTTAPGVGVWANAPLGLARAGPANARLTAAPVANIRSGSGPSRTTAHMQCKSGSGPRRGSGMAAERAVTGAREASAASVFVPNSRATVPAPAAVTERLEKAEAAMRTARCVWEAAKRTEARARAESKEAYTTAAVPILPAATEKEAAALRAATLAFQEAGGTRSRAAAELAAARKAAAAFMPSAEQRRAKEASITRAKAAEAAAAAAAELISAVERQRAADRQAPTLSFSATYPRYGDWKGREAKRKARKAAAAVAMKAAAAPTPLEAATNSASTRSLPRAASPTNDHAPQEPAAPLTPVLGQQESRSTSGGMSMATVTKARAAAAALPTGEATAASVSAWDALIEGKNEKAKAEERLRKAEAAMRAAEHASMVAEATAAEVRAGLAAAMEAATVAPSLPGALQRVRETNVARAPAGAAAPAEGAGADAMAAAAALVPFPSDGMHLLGEAGFSMGAAPTREDAPPGRSVWFSSRIHP